ncbi:hypothetical protein [Halobacterium noricense]|uniref:hypothetical protein n=1 Tax=Halobacterium noricense TaxID=223182 RepID=UPI001E457F0B|nr:hypothetical protein LT974_12205 [Halobacterium noricense]
MTATLAGCSDNSGDGTETGTPTGTATDTTTETDSSEDETTTEEETEDDPEVDRPANYRWDMSSWVNTELRDGLGQYVEGNVNRVLPSHPAFEYSTEQPEDDHPVDFVGLKLYREAQFDVMSENPNTGPMEQVVESFVDDSLYESAKNNRFVNHDVDAPTSYDSEAWLNAETVEDSLDLGHDLVVSIAKAAERLSTDEMAAITREAYKRHHDFDVLAWEVPMQGGSLKSGMMYSPDDDKVRSFNIQGPWLGEESRQLHTEIQDWNVINNPNDAGRNPTDLHHPLRFHTDEWNRGFVGGGGFEDAKNAAMSMIYGIGADNYLDFNYEAVGIVNRIVMTTGATEQLTRTLLDYNKSGVDAEFDDIWQLSSFAAGKHIDDPSLNGVIDTVESGGEDYDEYFGGGFAFYEVDNEDIIDEVKADQAGDYDNFGQVYDELEAA